MCHNVKSTILLWTDVINYDYVNYVINVWGKKKSNNMMMYKKDTIHNVTQLKECDVHNVIQWKNTFEWMMLKI